MIVQVERLDTENEKFERRTGNVKTQFLFEVKNIYGCCEKGFPFQVLFF